jgi:hypothetical protein
MFSYFTALTILKYLSTPTRAYIPIYLYVRFVNSWVLVKL